MRIKVYRYVNKLITSACPKKIHIKNSQKFLINLFPQQYIHSKKWLDIFLNLFINGFKIIFTSNLPGRQVIFSEAKSDLNLFKFCLLTYFQSFTYDFLGSKKWLESFQILFIYVIAIFYLWFPRQEKVTPYYFLSSLFTYFQSFTRHFIGSKKWLQSIFYLI